MPFSAAGIVIMMLVVAMLGHAAWSRHQRSLNVVDDASSSALLTIAMGVQNDLQAAVRYTVYRALWEVSKNADDYGRDGERELAIESLAAKYFAEQAAALPNLYKQHDARIELEIPSGRPVFDLWECDNGYAWATAKLPSQARVKVISWDNSLVLELPCENLEVFIDSRYFLLQRRMREFIDGLGSVGTKWAVMEYIAAWAGAWLRKKVTMNASRSRAFFELAWATHELDIFGSADYFATVSGLIDSTAVTSEISEDILSNTTVVVKPLKTADVETMGEYVDRALEALTDASTALTETREHVRRASNNLTQTPENVDNIGPALKNAQTALEGAIASVARAQGHVSEVAQQFEQLIDFTARSANQDMAMRALHESLVERMREDYPSPREQVAWGIRGTLLKIDNLEIIIITLAREVGADNTIAEPEELMTDLLDEIISSVQALLVEPIPKRWVEFTSYAEPGSYEGEPPKSVGGIAPVYIDGEGDGTIGSLKIVLQNVRSNLDKMRRLAERAEPPLDEITSAEIDETLKQKLELNAEDFSGINREQLYELLPPPPIQSQPGLSVFHDFSIKKVRYRREDPAGWFGSPTPTPIPLWFIGVTLWWAQWDIILELEDGAIEEIFDFDNPTLPLTHEAMGEEFIVHKPLAYRFEVLRNTFNVRLVIISLRPFNIS